MIVIFNRQFWNTEMISHPFFTSDAFGRHHKRVAHSWAFWDVLWPSFLLLLSAICQTGRLYFGTVDENYPYKLRFNGLFEITDHIHLGRPVYRHESLLEFLYYYDGAMGDGYWAIGPDVGTEYADFSIRSIAVEPETAEGHWRVHTSAGWVTEERISLSCVDIDFYPCTTGKVTATGHRINTFRPRQNRSHFADDMFKCIFLNENVWITLKILLQFVPYDSMNNITALVQIMAWRR